MPTFIGIAGLSGSGKTTLARALAAQLEGAAIFPLDAYYKPLGHLTIEERKQINFDHPDALDWELALLHMEALAHGLAIEIPVYNFATHTREEHTQRLAPSEFVVVEGLLTLWQDGVRARLHTKVFVDTPAETCLERRLARDVVERQRKYEEVLDQWTKTVHPMAEQFILPSRAHADLVADGFHVEGTALELVLDRLRRDGRLQDVVEFREVLQ